MAEKTGQDAAAKQRIITHMNNDHRDSVVRYLQYFHKVPSGTAWDGKMTDIDLEKVTLSARGKTYQVPIKPPMTSYAQARERVVELDKEARKALGHSDVTVKQYVPPTGIWTLEIVFLLISYAALTQRWWYAPGQIVEQLAGPRAAALGWRSQPYILPGLAAVHVVEATAFALIKAPKHSIDPNSSVYWKWIGSMLFEGRFAWERFDGFVKAQREKQKH